MSWGRQEGSRAISPERWTIRAKVEVTGASLPGGARETTTGEDGLYRIVDLPPATYTAVASEMGFSTGRREGVQITAAFTATINSNLMPGSGEQTVTVSSEAPVLDT